MRPGNNQRRPRGRPNRKHNVPSRAQSFDSHGPDVRIRGNASQVYEKYVNLARDASSSGDRIAAESYFQFAEHYFRIMNDSTDPQRAPQQPRHDRQGQPRDGQDQAQDGQEQPIAGQEQPHVEWPGDGKGANGSAVEAAQASASAAQEDEPPRKPRQRPRRRPGNGAAEQAAEATAEAAAEEEPQPKDTGSALADSGDEKSTTTAE
jgi:hypothetical protein